MLNNRLLHIANNVPVNAKVLDVGCDHAYLSIYLCQHRQVQAVIASDIVDGPVEAARKNIRQAGLTDRIRLIQADGVLGIEPGEANCVIIAGMGSGTIIDILAAGKHVVEQCHTLLLQPMIGADKLRIWLADHGWECVHEELCLDNNRLYEILVAQPCQKSYTINTLQALIGKLQDCLLFDQHLQNLIDKQQQILSRLRLANDTAQIADKIVSCETLLRQLQEVQDENKRNKCAPK